MFLSCSAVNICFFLLAILSPVVKSQPPFINDHLDPSGVQQVHGCSFMTKFKTQPQRHQEQTKKKEETNHRKGSKTHISDACFIWNPHVGNFKTRTTKKNLTPVNKLFELLNDTTDELQHKTITP